MGVFFLNKSASMCCDSATPNKHPVMFLYLTNRETPTWAEFSVHPVLFIEIFPGNIFLFSYSFIFVGISGSRPKKKASVSVTNSDSQEISHKKIILSGKTEASFSVAFVSCDLVTLLSSHEHAT